MFYVMKDSFTKGMRKCNQSKFECPISLHGKTPKGSGEGLFGHFTSVALLLRCNGIKDWSIHMCAVTQAFQNLKVL